MRVAVIGAGTMGHGIAQVSAMAGDEVVLTDSSEAVLAAATKSVRGNLAKGVEKGKVTQASMDAALGRLRTGTFDEALDGADLVVEAVPERLDLKQDLFRRAAARVSPACVLATNTSSLSVAAIASAVPSPERVIGTHFFNPVHLMELLEIVVAPTTAPGVLESVRAWGGRLGKEVIVVRDFPGFATSRLGVALGMEAIRMVEQGVASAEDIDKAMVLGYRHPVGPLKLTDMVGLDVRANIGEYLARELGNAAFEPPKLMRDMIADGRLGKKSGRGFYGW